MCIYLSIFGVIRSGTRDSIIKADVWGGVGIFGGQNQPTHLDGFAYQATVSIMLVL